MQTGKKQKKTLHFSGFIVSIFWGTLEHLFWGTHVWKHPEVDKFKYIDF